MAIDAVDGASGQHARLWVERRADPHRRAGHLPPIIAECAAKDAEAALSELRPIASDNLALAQAIRRWQADRARSDRP